MATNLAIDPDLLDRAVEVSGERTKKAIVTKALQEFIARREQKKAHVHLHAVESGSRLWQAHLAFRDALRADSNLRPNYQSLTLR